jgi:hypothetical protein
VNHQDPSVARGFFSRLLERFWSIYAIQIRKTEAELKRFREQGESLDIVGGTKLYGIEKDGAEEKYIKRPDNWLRGGFWRKQSASAAQTGGRTRQALASRIPRCLSSCPALVKDLGLAFTINGLGNKVRDWCDAAGLPQCSSHGLRKAAAVILAENERRRRSRAVRLVEVGNC